MNKTNICIIHYNTPEMTECLVKSINRFVPNAKIFIFDNSDKSPFVYRQKGLVYIDNTEGKYVNFDYELEHNYVTLTSGTAYLNHYISFKHCISVQKCISLIKDNFVLLDSDVLLKKDITEIVDENSIFVGSIEHKENARDRVLPYMLYINVKMCKEVGIKFFNKNYMHGLTNKDSNRYDTGAYFYKVAKEYPHKIIDIEDYIVHYKAGSWLEDAKKYIKYNQISQEMWLNNNRKYWKKLRKKNKVVVYTAITGGYDNILLQTYVDDGFDYICFTDNPNAESGLYDVHPIPEELKSLSTVKQQRCLKINPHKYLPEYDISIWLDGNVELLENPLELIDKHNYIYIPQHPKRSCIYDEARECIRVKKDVPENIIPQMERYKQEGYPVKYGLVQSNIIIRKHNNPKCIQLMETWWNELKNNSHRDQLSFNYAAWKNPDVEIKFLDKMIYRSKYFYWNKGHGNNIKVSNKERLNMNVISSKSDNVPIKIIQTTNNSIVKVINKPTTVRTLETYRLPTKSIGR